MTAFTPVQLFMMMGKAETKATSRTAEKFPRPNYQRQEDILGPARPPHGDSDRNTHHRGQHKPGQEAGHRLHCVVRQDPRGSQARERRRHLLERGEQPVGKNTHARDDFPEPAHHHERKRGACRGAPARTIPQHRR
ncbi:MAG: hypothetical protein HYU73_14590 [Betaproteobacteria bacterium]|nr:hypothetical protein [Betaproteobacteria bacterium]